MPHVSEYEEIDRHAGRCARTAILSEKEPLDIVAICEGLRRPLPISEDDLRALAEKCDRWGIRCNLDDERSSAWYGFRKRPV